jgi:glycosyltransferase involved in cell wall biosynthesis
MKIKLVHVINDFSAGGAEKSLLWLIRELDRKKYDITVIPLRERSGLLHDFEQTGVRIFHLNMRRKRDWRKIFELMLFFRTDKPDIVHVHLGEAELYGRFAAILARVPVILSTDQNIDDWKKKTRRLKTKIRFALNRLAVKHSCGVIAVADAVKQHLISNERIDPEKIFIVKNSIPIPQLQTDSQIRHEDIVIGNAARLIEIKGHRHILKAFRIALSSCPDIKLVIAGDGPLRRELERLATELGIADKVTFMGFVDDIDDFLKRIDIFVHPSYIEGLPHAVLEAMAAAKPVIVTPVSGLTEIIQDQKSGVFVEPGHEQAIADAITGLVRNPAKRTQLGINARKIIEEKHNIIKAAKKLATLYDNLLQQKQ